MLLVKNTEKKKNTFLIAFAKGCTGGEVIKINRGDRMNANAIRI